MSIPGTNSFVWCTLRILLSQIFRLSQILVTPYLTSRGGKIPWQPNPPSNRQWLSEMYLPQLVRAGGASEERTGSGVDDRNGRRWPLILVLQPILISKHQSFSHKFSQAEFKSSASSLCTCHQRRRKKKERRKERKRATTTILRISAQCPLGLHLARLVPEQVGVDWISPSPRHADDTAIPLCPPKLPRPLVGLSPAKKSSTAKLAGKPLPATWATWCRMCHWRRKRSSQFVAGPKQLDGTLGDPFLEKKTFPNLILCFPPSTFPGICSCLFSLHHFIIVLTDEECGT